MSINDEGFIRNHRWPRPIPDYGSAGLADKPLTLDQVERISELVTKVKSNMMELIEAAWELRTDGHDAVGYQLETLSIDLEMAIEWEFVTGEVVTAQERIERIINNTWSG